MVYESEGKQAQRELDLAIAQHFNVRTYGTFWGTGIDSRMFAAAGLDVIACEIVRAKHDAMDGDALTGGYRTHKGRASKLTERRGMFHADFDGGPSRANFREVQRLAAITDDWLVVTLSMDHIRDEAMMGEAAFYTVPAWLTGASGFTLEYLTRYKRNRFGQTMWSAILRRSEGKGEWHPVQALQVAYSLGERSYWASRRMYKTDLLPHRFSPRNAREKVGDHARYLRKKASLGTRVCRSCEAGFQPTHGRQVHCTASCRRTTYAQIWYATHSEQVKASVREWREAKRLAAVSGTTAEAISMTPETPELAA